MKVLLINGSPKARGCTFTALNEVSKSLEKQGVDTEIMHIGNNPVRGCMGCGKCSETGKCVFDDDVCNTLIEKMNAADALVVGSPVYYSGPNGALCALLDRMFYAGAKGWAYKPAAAVASCRRSGITTTTDRLNKYFTISQMPVVASQYWNGVHGNTPEEVEQDLEGMQIMRTLGSNMAWLLRSIEQGGVEHAPREKRQRTNFIR